MIIFDNISIILCDFFCVCSLAIGSSTLNRHFYHRDATLFAIGAPDPVGVSVWVCLMGTYRFFYVLYPGCKMLAMIAAGLRGVVCRFPEELAVQKEFDATLLGPAFLVWGLGQLVLFHGLCALVRTGHWNDPATHQNISKLEIWTAFRYMPYNKLGEATTCYKQCSTVLNTSMWQFDLSVFYWKFLVVILTPLWAFLSVSNFASELYWYT